MRRFATTIQFVGVVALLPVSLFITPGSFFNGVLPLAIAAWALWLVGLAAGARAFPASVAGRVAVVGGIALFVLLAISTVASPDKPAAAGNLNLAIAYLGWLLAAGSAFSTEDRAHLAEPLTWGTALLAGTWGLSERIAPSSVHFPHSRIAFGRLLEPIGYWNAMGALAGIGLVLAVGLASSERRPQWLKAAAAASSPILIAALWLSFSRGALAATACGLAAICVARRNWGTVRIAAGAALLTVGIAVCCEALPGVRSVSGDLGQRESDGLVLLVALLLLAALASAGQWVSNRSAKSARAEVPASLIKVALVASIALGLLPAAIVLSGSTDSGTPPAATGADASRLQSLESNRSKYWSVAMDEFSNSPITGKGSGSFRAAWQRNSPRGMTALNAHSLEIETLAELGLIGAFCLLLLFLGTWTAGSRRRSSAARPLAAASAGLAVWLAHSAVDWDWQVPGLMFVVIAIAAAVIYAPRAGFDSFAENRLRLLAALIGIAGLAWSLHMWQAHQLQIEAQRMTDTAKILGWTPRREKYVIERLKEASWLNPSPLPQAELAAALFDMGRSKPAAAEALRLARKNPDWWFGWALVWKYRSGTSFAIAGEARVKSLELRGFKAAGVSAPKSE